LLLKIILTNDDGINAPGLAALTEIVRRTADTIIVAPADPQSGVGHRVTTHAAIRVDRLGQNRHRVDGTPVDCVRVALKEIAPDADWVIAGINPGANLGSDLYQSGTVAAAREAAILGYRAIALSQYIAKNRIVDWGITGLHAAGVLDMLLKKNLAKGCYWNVNLPHALAADAKITYKFCNPDPNPHKYTFRRVGSDYTYEGTIHERPRDPGRDVAVCFGGEVAISKLSIRGF
jgi:5'-nucleotidase